MPADVIPALGGLKHKRAFGWLHGVDFMTATFPFKGTLYVGVPKAARVAAGAVLGDVVELELMLDESPRKVELADPVSEAKRAETREARVEKALTRPRELG